MKIVSKIGLAASLLLIAGSSSAQEAAALTAPQWVMEAGFALALAADRSQTLGIRGFCKGRTGCDLHETNPLLGRDPSPAKVNQYFAAAIVGHALVTALTPQAYRSLWQGTSLVLELAVVGHNKRLGLRGSF